jgi:hypothetical protein
MEAAATWNSLEIAKLVIAALTPLLLAAAGFWLNRRLKSLEQAQWSQQKVIERRIKAYDELAPPLNDLFCFYCYVGSWKEQAPPDVVRLKRRLDRIAHISAPLFDSQFLKVYEGLLNTCFATFGRWGDDAKLRTLPDRREEAPGADWQAGWADCFANRSQASEPTEVKDAYAALMSYLARAIGAVDVEEHLLGAAHMPGNFDSRAAGLVSQIQRDDPRKSDL